MPAIDAVRQCNAHHSFGMMGIALLLAGVSLVWASALFRKFVAKVKAANRADINKSYPGRDRVLIPIGAAILYAYAVSNTQIAQRVLPEGLIAAIIEADTQLIGFALRLSALFDLVAGYRTAYCTGHGGGRPAASAADLVPQQSADDAAQCSACSGGAAASRHKLNGVDHAVINRVRL